MTDDDLVGELGRLLTSNWQAGWENIQAAFRALRDERDMMGNRSDLFAGIVRDVANALGQDWETTHDLGEKVAVLRAEAARWERTCRDIQGATVARAEKAEAERDRRDGWLQAAIARAEGAEARVKALEDGLREILGHEGDPSPGDCLCQILADARAVLEEKP